MIRRFYSLLLLMSLTATGIEAQSGVLDNSIRFYRRVQSLAGFSGHEVSLINDLRPAHLLPDSVTTFSVLPEFVPGDAPWKFALSADYFVSRNDDVPSGSNDGAVWQGAGITRGFQGGITTRYRWITASFRPEYFYAANLDFELYNPGNVNEKLHPGRSFFSSQRRDNIDLPQRFGDEAYGVWSPGQSFVRLDYGGAAIGISTENQWWGPGVYNAILMTNNARGFKHTFIETSRPIKTPVGRVEAKWMLGTVRESEYFDTLAFNDRRSLTGAMLTVNPWKGFYVGVGSTYMRTRPDSIGFRMSDVFAVIDNPLWYNGDTLGFQRCTGQMTICNDTFAVNHQPKDRVADRMMSFMARYVSEESGIEVYAEWAKGERNRSFREFIARPGYGRGFVLGFIKSLSLGKRHLLSLNAEYTRLAGSFDNTPRDTTLSGQTAFYANYAVPQGYTNEGQIMGAYIGPGATSINVGLAYLTPWSMLAVQGHRRLIDDDRYYHFRTDYHPMWRHEVEFGVGVDGMVRFWGVELLASYRYEYTFNRSWLFVYDTPTMYDNRNLHVAFTLRKHLGINLR